MASTVTFLTQKVSGLKMYRGRLSLNPNLPEWIKRLKFKFTHQENLYEMEFFSNRYTIKLCEQGMNDCNVFYSKPPCEVVFK